MNFDIEGRIYYCEDYVNTDVMAPGRYDPIYEDEQLAKIALIDYKGLEPFVDSKIGKSQFQIIVAGRDFGCGSSRETAPMALSAAGVKVIIAKSYARIFFRNCINMGSLLPITLDHSWGSEIHGQWGHILWSQKKAIINEHSLDLPNLGVVEEILKGGGLSAFTQSGGLQ